MSEEGDDTPPEDLSTSAPDTPSPPAGLSNPPTRSEVLAYLDWEIQNTREQTKIVGASTWSLTLALGAVLWLLISEARYSWAELPPVFYLIVGFSLVQDLLAGAYYVFREKVPQPVPVRRVLRPELVFGSRRRGLLFLLLRCLGLLFVLIHSPEYVTPLARWLAGTWFALPIPILLFGFLFSSLDVELHDPPEVGKKAKMANFLASTFFLVFPFICSMIYWRPFLSRRLTFSPEDYKTSLLVVVATFLVSLILESRLRAEIGPALISLRRDLALGVLRSEDAAQHAALVVSGMTEDAYVQAELIKYENLLRTASAGLTRINEDLAEVETTVTSGSKYDPERVRGYLVNIAPLLDLADKLDLNASSFRRKLERVADTDKRDRFKLKASSFEEPARALRGEARSCVQRIRKVIDRPISNPPTPPES